MTADEADALLAEIRDLTEPNRERKQRLRRIAARIHAPVVPNGPSPVVEGPDARPEHRDSYWRDVLDGSRDLDRDDDR